MPFVFYVDCEASLERGASAPLRRLMRIAKRRFNFQNAKL